MLVGPRHSFADLAESIDAAFARWHVAHLHQFELSNGRLIGPSDPDAEPFLVDEETVTPASTLASGDRFIYVFDLGDWWEHECVVERTEVDPTDEYGDAPLEPVPIFGWGWIPDQYGRRTPDQTDENEESGDEPVEPGPSITGRSPRAGP